MAKEEQKNFKDDTMGLKSAEEGAVTKQAPLPGSLKLKAEDAPVVSVVNSDPVVSFLKRKAAISATEINVLSQHKDGGTRDILVGGMVEFRDGMGRERSRAKTILDVNEHLCYAWVSPKSLEDDPVYMNGWYPVDRNNAGGENIPEHYFDPDGLIKRGECVFVWTTRQLFNAHQDRESRLKNSRLSGLTNATLSGGNGVNQQMSVTEEAV